MKSAIYFVLAMMMAGPVFSQQISFDASVLTEAWQAEGFNVPESVLYDGDRNVVFVSNINGKPTDMDHNGFISKMQSNGDIIKMKWIEGDLSAPKGMGIYEDKLYVTDIDAVVEIDIDEERVLNRYKIDGAEFMNDIAIDDEGNVYATDMSTNKIHQLKNGKISLWMEDEKLKSPNGLFVHNGKLLVGCKQILAIDLKTKNTEVVVDNLDDGVDGITMDKYGNLFFSHWKGNVFVYGKGKKVKEILSTAKKDVQSADIGINTRDNLLYVPTFFDNKVVAYHIHIPEE